MEKKIVFVRRPGGYKCEDAWMCSSPHEANTLKDWLKHLGITAETMNINEHNALPDRQPEE